MPIIKLGGQQKFSHLKKWASELPSLRTTDLYDDLTSIIVFITNILHYFKTVISKLFEFS
jgi:hypothetical protein